jgi:hypothetical protein
MHTATWVFFVQNAFLGEEAIEWYYCHVERELFNIDGICSHRNTRTSLARTTQPRIHDKDRWQLCKSLIR